MHTSQREFIQLSVLAAVGCGLTNPNGKEYLNQLLRQFGWTEHPHVVTMTVELKPQLDQIRVYVDTIERTITYWVSINIDTLAIEFDVS